MVQMECMYFPISLSEGVTRHLSRFCWVGCQIAELKHCPNNQMLMDTLKCLPNDLEDIYDQILDRINEREMASANTILQWLLLGMRPLTVEELSIAVTFDAATGKFDSSLELVHPDVVIQVCSSLVTKADDNTVQLAHASVKEYFLSKPRFKRGDEITLSDTRTGHALITHCCLRYTLNWLWHDGIGYLDMSLLDYSTQFWVHHYKHSNINTTLQDIVMTFFQCNGCIFVTGSWR